MLSAYLVRSVLNGRDGQVELQGYRGVQDSAFVQQSKPRIVLRGPDMPIRPIDTMSRFAAHCSWADQRMFASASLLRGRPRLRGAVAPLPLALVPFGPISLAIAFWPFSQILLPSSHPRS